MRNGAQLPQQHWVHELHNPKQDAYQAGEHSCVTSKQGKGVTGVAVNDEAESCLVTSGEC